MSAWSYGGRGNGSENVALLWPFAVVERTTEHVPTRFATSVDEWLVTGLSDYSRSVTSALRTHACRLRWNAGRLLRLFLTRAEDVFTRIAAMVNKRRRTEPSRSMTSTFWAHVWCSLHERLKCSSLVPVLTAQIPQCSFASRFCVVRFGASLKRKASVVVIVAC